MILDMGYQPGMRPPQTRGIALAEWGWMGAKGRGGYGLVEMSSRGPGLPAYPAVREGDVTISRLSRPTREPVIGAWPMTKTFTISVDEKMDAVLDELKGELGRPSKAEVVRLGVALLKIAADARKKNGKLNVTTEDGKVETILLPA